MENCVEILISNWVVIENVLDEIVYVVLIGFCDCDKLKRCVNSFVFFIYFYLFGFIIFVFFLEMVEYFEGFGLIKMIVMSCFLFFMEKGWLEFDIKSCEVKNILVVLFC